MVSDVGSCKPAHILSLREDGTLTSAYEFCGAAKIKEMLLGTFDLGSDGDVGQALLLGYLLSTQFSPADWLAKQERFDGTLSGHFGPMRLRSRHHSALDQELRSDGSFYRDGESLGRLVGKATKTNEGLTWTQLDEKSRCIVDGPRTVEQGSTNAGCFQGSGILQSGDVQTWIDNAGNVYRRARELGEFDLMLVGTIEGFRPAFRLAAHLLIVGAPLNP